MKENINFIFGLGAGAAFLLGISVILMYSIKIIKYQVNKKRYIKIVNVVPIFFMIIIGIYINLIMGMARIIYFHIFYS